MSIGNGLELRTSQNFLVPSHFLNYGRSYTMIVMVHRGHSSSIVEYGTDNDCVDLVEMTAGKARHRRVKFKEFVEVQEIVRVEDYSRKVVKATWYNLEEYRRMQREIRETVKLMEFNFGIDDVRFCKRGVEGFTKTGAKIRQRNRLQAIDAVLHEQTTHSHADLAVCIARACSVVTHSCKLAAHLDGIADEKYVRAYTSFQPAPVRLFTRNRF